MEFFNDNREHGRTRSKSILAAIFVSTVVLGLFLMIFVVERASGGLQSENAYPGRQKAGPSTVEQDPNDSSERFRESISLEELADKYLGADGVIATSGAYASRYTGQPQQKNHCSVSIMVASMEDSEEGTLHSEISCEVKNPLGDNPLSGIEDIHIIATSTVETSDPIVFDENTDFRLTRPMYDAIVAVLQYYSGTSEHDAYTEDPLEDIGGIEYNFRTY